MRNKSFTLIELLVVIVIIGILAGVITVATTSYISKANFAKAQAFSSTVQTELLSDLVSEWTFDEDSGINAKDTWGNNDGTLVGANGLPQLQSKENCVYGTCYSFDGVDDYIDCGNDNSFNFQNNNFSISAWVKLNSKWGHIISKRENFVTAIPFQFYTTDSNKISFSYYNTISGWDSNVNGVVLKNDQWYFAVVSYYFEGSGISKIYVNGEEYAVKSHGFLTQNDIASKVRMGSWSNTSEMFKGLIDDVRIYKIALTSTQIKQEYIAGLDSLLSKNLISKEEYNIKIESLASN